MNENDFREYALKYSIQILKIVKILEMVSTVEYMNNNMYIGTKNNVKMQIIARTKKGIVVLNNVDLLNKNIIHMLLNEKQIEKNNCYINQNLDGILKNEGSLNSSMELSEVFQIIDNITSIWDKNENRAKCSYKEYFREYEFLVNKNRIMRKNKLSTISFNFINRNGIQIRDIILLNRKNINKDINDIYYLYNSMKLSFRKQFPQYSEIVLGEKVMCTIIKKFSYIFYENTKKILNCKLPSSFEINSNIKIIDNPFSGFFSEVLFDDCLYKNQIIELVSTNKLFANVDYEYLERGKLCKANQYLNRNNVYISHYTTLELESGSTDIPTLISDNSIIPIIYNLNIDEKSINYSDTTFWADCFVKIQKFHYRARFYTSFFWLLSEIEYIGKERKAIISNCVSPSVEIKLKRSKLFFE